LSLLDRLVEEEWERGRWGREEGAEP
jgi:hypothetical protein